MTLLLEHHFKKTSHWIECPVFGCVDILQDMNGDGDHFQTLLMT